MNESTQPNQRRSRSYMKAIIFIALNDNAGNGDSIEEIGGYITVALVSEVWKLSTNTVAKEIAWIRERDGLTVGARES